MLKQHQSRTSEHLWLNHNEKQWLTNSNILAECPVDFYGPSEWAQPDLYPLPLSVPVFGFNLLLTPQQLNKICQDWGYWVNSKDCGYIHYRYNMTMQTNNAVVARNPQSKLFLCGVDCDKAQGNNFLINQNSMIPWFTNTLWGAIKDIQT